LQKKLHIVAARLEINRNFAENIKNSDMNIELIIKKRSLRQNRRTFNNNVLEKELRNSVSPEDFRAKLVECVVKQYEDVQC